MEKEKMTKLEKQWVLYDVGNSAFVMLVSTIIPIYFKNMATASGISAANATAYGKDVGISDSSMLLALLLTQVVAFPCSSLFGKLARKYESEKLISVCIGAYFLIALFALQLDTAWKFWFFATCVGVFQGAIQALSRSYYAKIIPKEKASEYFGIFDIFGKGASFLGTMLMGISTQLFHTSKAGVVMIALMFVFGFITFQLQRSGSFYIFRKKIIYKFTKLQSVCNY